jgi:putative oxidoreductase
VTGVLVQRLFSTFANGLPGLGLLLQRLIAGSVLVQVAIVQLRAPAGSAALLPQVIGIGAGLLLILGLWTPVVGAVIAIFQLSAFVSGAPDPRIPVLLATLGASLALIGPGAWSVDARLFGRKQISVPQRQDF